MQQSAIHGYDSAMLGIRCEAVWDLYGKRMGTNNATLQNFTTYLLGSPHKGSACSILRHFTADDYPQADV